MGSASNYDSESCSSDYMDDEDYARKLGNAMQGNWTSRHHWGDFVSSYFAAGKEMSVSQIYAAYKRKERLLRSYGASEDGDTGRIRGRLSRGVQELGECLRSELSRRKVSAFCAGTPQGNSTPSQPILNHFATPTRDTFSDAVQVQDKEVNSCLGLSSDTEKEEEEEKMGLRRPPPPPSQPEEQQDPQKTPPKNVGKNASLMVRLMEAPYKKTMVDVPQYNYNSDDDVFEESTES